MFKRIKEIIIKSDLSTKIAFFAAIITMLVALLSYMLNNKFNRIQKHEYIFSGDLTEIQENIGATMQSLEIQNIKLTKKNNKLISENQQLKKNYRSIKQRLDSTLYFIDNKSNNSATEYEFLNYEIKLMKNRINNIEDKSNKLDENEINSLKPRIKIIEDAIIDNPEKALSVPIIKKDLENLNSNYQLEVLNLKNDITRAHEQYKWTMTMIVTILISLFAVILRKKN